MYQGSLSCTIMYYIAHLCKSSCHWFSYLITRLGSLIWPSLYKREEKQDLTWNPGYEPPGIKPVSSKIQWLYRVHADHLLSFIKNSHCMLFSPLKWKLISTVTINSTEWNCPAVDVTYRLACASLRCVYICLMNHGSSCQVMIGLLSGSYCNSTVQVNVLVMCVCYCAVITLPSCALSEALYMAIGLQAGEEDVEEPESKQKQWSEDFGDPRASQFATYGRPPA